MCFGFLGIQFGFALQNANVSRIFQTLGADVGDIAILWVAAPLTGLIVQPIIGHYSDRTWTRLGRRRPYFLAGAILATVALLAMPHASSLWIAAGVLWLMDASFNVSMEPFRAFVGDQLSSRQRPLGYAMQSVFIGVGAVVASALPWILAHLGVANTAPEGVIPATVRYSFYAGGVVLIGAMLWTVFRSHEYPPDRLQSFSDAVQSPDVVDARGAWKLGAVLLTLGLLGWFVIERWFLPAERRDLYLLIAMLFVFGALLVWRGFTRSRGMLSQVLGDLYVMPTAMRKLAWVQFFSWFAMFAMWLYTTPAVAAVQFGSTDPTSVAYNAGANWVGVLFAVYNGLAVLAAACIPWMVRAMGVRWTHLINVAMAGLGLISIAFIHNPYWLIASMVGVGFGWASILSLPYTLLADHLPTAKMGIYMGIFNFFIVIPQLLAASVLGLLIRHAFGGHSVGALVLGGVSLIVAGLFTLRVHEPQRL
ncbi:MAG TPA: MFS transporter [Oleiagrimonas sp.]|nr:MFS transporter [Oleiagrimonas sp.]